MINIIQPNIVTRVAIGTYIGEGIQPHMTLRIVSKMKDNAVAVAIDPVASGKWMVADFCRVTDLSQFEQEHDAETRDALEHDGAVLVNGIIYLYMSDGMYTYEYQQANGLMRIGNNTVPTIAHNAEIITNVYEG